MDSQLNDYVFKVLQDFEDIFMAEGLKNALGSDYNNFLGNVAFLKGWPVQKLSEYPSSCMFQYFNAGRTMVRDSNDSDWIYIVKSGSISVMKKLRHVVPRRSLAWERENDIARRGPNVTVPFRERRRRQKILPPLKLPDVPRPQFHSQFELQIKMEETVPGAFKENDRLGILDYDSIVHEYKSRLQQGRVTEPSPREEKRIRRGSVMDETEEVSEEEEVEEEQENEEAVETRRSRFPEIHKTTRGVFMSASKPRQRRRRSESQNKENLSRTQDLQQEQDSDNEWDHGSDEEDPQYLAEVTSEKPESEIEHQPEGSLAAPPPTKPVFIMVQVLEKGQYFGVGDVVFRETQPSFSVVSNGAECLLISKAFFRQHSTESIINALRKTETPYPTEAELQEKLQVNTDWLSYRTSTYHSMVDPILDRKARRRQYTLGYSGQYNFRTGPT